MMKRLLASLSLFALCLSAEAMAAPKPPPVPAVLSEADRAVPGERPVLLSIPQERIEASIELGNIPPPPGGGIIDTLIIMSADKRTPMLTANLRQQADARAAPVRNALAGFDVDALARDATATALGRVDWFRPGAVQFGRDDGPAARKAFAEAASTAQVAFVTWRYELSSDLTQIRVIADVSLARRGAGGLTGLFRQRVASIAQLRTRSFEPGENAASWAANNGARAKAALSGAFAGMGELLPRALGLSAADYRRLTDKKTEKTYLGGYYGPLIARASDGSGTVTIWADGLVSLSDIP